MHVDFRSWCRYCIEGRGVSRHHEKGKEEEAIGTIASVGSCFWTPEAFEEEMDYPLDMIPRMGFGTMAVDAKGPTPSSTEWLSNKIEEAGYSGVSITMKSGQEESI